MASDERGEERGFKVADRRRFSETGEARDTKDVPASPGSEGDPRTAESAPAGETLLLAAPARGWYIYSNINSFYCPVVIRCFRR